MRFSSVLALVLGSAVAAAAPAETAESATARVVGQIEAREFAGASSALRSLLRHSPERPDLWNLLGICESELDHTDAAREAFTKALDLAPDSPEVNENIGNLYFRQGAYADAKKYLSRAVALGSDKPGVAFSLAASQIRTDERREGLAGLIRLEGPLGKDASYWTERGWAELRSNNASAAVSFDRALAVAPDDVRALNGAASAAEAAGDDEKAISLLLRARKAAPDDVRTLLHFGSVCLRRDLSVDAREAVQRAHKLAPANNLALFLCARVEIAFQQWQRSHELFTEFDGRVPNYAPTQYALGWLDLKLNRPVEARKHLERSLALAPDNADVQYELGQLELSEGNLDGAELHLRTALDKDERHAKAHIAYGDLMMKKADLEKAKQHYEAAIEADPKSGPAHYKLSTVLMRLHQTERADRERALGAALNAEAVKASKTVLVLAEPDGRLLTGEPGAKKGSE